MVLNTDDGCDVVVATGPDVDAAVAFYTDGCSEMVEDLLPDGCRCVYPPARMVRDAAEDGGLIVAKDGERIVAACILNRSPDDAYLEARWLTDLPKGEFLVLHALRVSPDHRGMGLAGRLLDKAADLARARGFRSVRLDCLEGNEGAFRLYGSHGFVQTDVVTITYEDIGSPQRFRLFELVLRDGVSTSRSASPGCNPRRASC